MQREVPDPWMQGSEAIVQTICMNGTVGEKRKQREGLKERGEHGC